jgi:AbrB family looped-hinge helix DNA binding protein
MPVATMTSKGQVTMPKAVREQLKLKPGDRVEFLISDDGRVTVWPVTEDVTTLKGMLPKPKRTVTLQEMREAIKKRGAGL